MTLPTPSDEQRVIIDTAVSLTSNIVVDAVAGSGKTTLCMHIAQRLEHAEILILTYNKELKADSRKRAKELELSNVEVHTYHSLCRRYYGETDFTDEGIDHTLQTAHLQNYDASRPFRIIILDESQDINDMYYRLFRRFYADIAGAPVVMLIGDRYQMIYKFKGADERYLTRADEKYSVNEYPWSFLEMHETFRVTQSVCAFVNRAMLGEERLMSSRDGPEVIYVCDNAYARGKFMQYVNNVPDSEIMLLAPSIKSQHNPVREFANFLSNRGRRVFAPVNDDSTPDQRDMRGKIAVLTYHQAKGLERRVVIVFNFDSTYFSYFERHANPSECPNTLYVACTRAKEVLVLVHHNKPNRDGVVPGPLPFLNLEEVRNLCDVRGDLVETGIVNRSLSSTFTVTQLCSHLNFEQVREARTFCEFSECAEVSECTNDSECTSVIDTKDAVYTYFGPNGDRERDRIETVSEITGTAVPMMFAFYVHGSIYKVIPSKCKRIISNIPLTRAYRNGSVEEQRTARLEYILDRVDKFLEQANIYIAFVSGYVHKLNQITNYGWMTRDQARQAVLRMSQCVGDDCTFEQAVSTAGQCDISTTIQRMPAALRMKYEIHGIVDAIETRDHSKVLWEFKFVETLQAEHEIQTALYALLTKCECTSYRLFNVKTGEMREMIAPDVLCLREMAEKLVEIKISDTRDLSEAEFLADSELPERPPPPAPREEDLADMCDL